MKIIALIMFSTTVGTIATTLAGGGRPPGLVISPMRPGRQMADR